MMITSEDLKEKRRQNDFHVGLGEPIPYPEVEPRLAPGTKYRKAKNWFLKGKSLQRYKIKWDLERDGQKIQNVHPDLHDEMTIHSATYNRLVLMETNTPDSGYRFVISKAKGHYFRAGFRLSGVHAFVNNDGHGRVTARRVFEQNHPDNPGHLGITISDQGGH